MGGWGVKVAPIVATGLIFNIGLALAASYEDLKSTAVGRCQAIDPDDYRTGMLFNPDGYRSLYVRSECFQQAAIRFRDASLCAEVRQRLALFFSSWAISRKRCLELVAQGTAADQRTLDDMRRRYLKGAVRLRDFRVERNGNGRDFDLTPSFDGGYAHRYFLTFEIVPASAGATPVLLYSASHHLDGDNNLHVFVTQSELRRRFPGFALGLPYTLRATLTLDIGIGGQAGYWSDTFIERVFPIRHRSQSLTRQTRF